MLAALLAGCAPTADIYQNGAELAGKDVIVFVHGYYGSALREKGGGPRRFIRIPTILAGSFAIALESSSLSLRLSPELEVEGLMAQVSVFPFLYRNDVYGAFLGRVAASRPVVAFAYDWRKDLSAAAAQLSALVDELESKGARSISLLAHSMGGLVTTYYLAYGAQPPANPRLDWAGAQKIKRVAFLGVPFGGAIAIFRNMQHGTGYPWNEDLLEASTVASWPASYHLLPLHEARMVDPQGNELVVPLQDPVFWEKQKLGLLREDSTSSAARIAYTRAQVEKAARFQQLLRIDAAAPAHLRALNVRGKNRPTLAKGYFDGREFVFLPRDAKKKGWPFARLEEDGDGSIPLAATALPGAFARRQREVFTDFAHDRLFDDEQVEKECLDFLAAGN